MAGAVFGKGKILEYPGMHGEISAAWARQVIESAQALKQAIQAVRLESVVRQAIREALRRS